MKSDLQNTMWRIPLLLLGFVLLTFFISQQCFAQKKQGQVFIDSCLRELSSDRYVGNNEDTNKVKLLNSLSFGYCTIDPDQGIRYGQAGLDLATKLGWKKGIGWLNNSIGANYQTKPDFPKAIERYNLALNIFNELNFRNGIATVLLNIGNVYNNQIDYPKAFEYYQKALKVYEELQDKVNIAEINANIGLIFEQQAEISKALDYYSQSLAQYQQLGDKNKIASVYEFMGAIYNKKGDFPKAVEYFQKAKKIDENLNNKLKLAINEGNIGNVYFNQSDYNKALEYHFSSLKLFLELMQKDNAAYEYQIIGNIYIEMELYPTAIYNEKMSLKIAEETGNKELAGYVLGTIGNVYIQLAKNENNTEKTAGNRSRANDRSQTEGNIPAGKAARLKLAIDYLQQGLAIGTKMHINQLITYCYENLAEAYNLNGDFKKANEYSNSFHALNDSFFAKRNKEKIAILEMGNRFLNQHITDSLNQVKQDEISQLSLKKRTAYLRIAIGFSLFVLVIIIFMYFNYRKVMSLHKKVSLQKTELEKSALERERILHIVAHDLRSPVGYISYLSDLMLMGNRSGKKLTEYLRMIKTASAGSLDLINELVGQSDEQSEAKEDVGAVIAECCSMLNFKAKEKDQSIRFDKPENPIYIRYSHGKIKRVISNLLGNAIKFSNPGRPIEITLETEGTDVIIKVRDHGIGIPEKIKPEVFEMFTDSRREGTTGEKPFGLGLYISRQIVEAQGGTLTFDSAENEGTVFYVRLPQNSFKPSPSPKNLDLAQNKYSKMN